MFSWLLVKSNSLCWLMLTVSFKVSSVCFWRLDRFKRNSLVLFNCFSAVSSFQWKLVICGSLILSFSLDLLYVALSVVSMCCCCYITHTSDPIDNSKLSTSKLISPIIHCYNFLEYRYIELAESTWVPFSLFIKEWLSITTSAVNCNQISSSGSQ